MVIRKFFPSFCRSLARRRIGCIFVHDTESIEKAVSFPGRKILINLINEGYGNNQVYDLCDSLAEEFDLIFNPFWLAQIVANRHATNDFLSAHGISVPRRDVAGRQVFSMSSHRRSSSAVIFDNSNLAPSDAYNVEFVDTTIPIDGKHYYTSVRMMCIGTRVIKLIARARDCSENRPEVRDINTPQDRAKLRSLYDTIVIPNLGRLTVLAKVAGDAFGPGFYAHDVLIDSDSGEAFVCETELSFFPTTFMRRQRGLLDDAGTLFSTCNERIYASYAADQFATYCANSNSLTTLDH